MWTAGVGRLLITALLVVGILGLLVIAIVLVTRLLGFARRRLLSPDEPRLSGPELACEAARCGHVNPAGARYCARCGQPLTGGDLDAYG